MPLKGGIKLSHDRSSSESKNKVRGYSVLEADNMQEAISLKEAHPHLNWTRGCKIEIHESMLMPG